MKSARLTFVLGGSRGLGTAIVQYLADEGADDEPAQVFHRRERVMISGLLQLAERPIRGVMTPRAETDHIDLADSLEAVLTALMRSPIRAGYVDEPLFLVELSAVELQGLERRIALRIDNDHVDQLIVALYPQKRIRIVHDH